MDRAYNPSGVWRDRDTAGSVIKSCYFVCDGGDDICGRSFLPCVGADHFYRTSGDADSVLVCVAAPQSVATGISV